MKNLKSKSTSAEKSNRQDSRKRFDNNAQKNRIKTMWRKLKSLVENKADHLEILHAFREYESAVSKTDVFHHRNGARKISRANRFIRNAELLNNAGKFDDEEFQKRRVFRSDSEGRFGKRRFNRNRSENYFDKDRNHDKGSRFKKNKLSHQDDSDLQE